MLRLVAKHGTRTGKESQGVLSMSADAGFSTSDTNTPMGMATTPIG